MKRLMILLLAGVAITSLTGCPWWQRPVVPNPPVVNPQSPSFFSATVNNWYRNGLEDVVAAPGTDGSGAEDETPREVVEPDVIRRDGNLLYVLNQYRGLTIVDLESQTVLGNAPTSGYPRDLYLRGGRAYVLVGYAVEVTENDGLLECAMGARIYAVDVSDPANPAVEGSINLEGDFIDSRLVGDALYAVCASFTYSWSEGGDGVAVAEVVKEQTSDSWVTSVDLANPADLEPVETVRFDGYGGLIQASNTAIFVAASNWETGSTEIRYVDISDPRGRMAVRGAVTVAGQMADRYKMDAWNGTLRVVTNTWWPNRETHVTTVDLSNPDELAILGETRLENASGETTFATRFDGPRAYIVTYLQVDPLFVVDLSDPANPVVAGELKVPGWSTHIEPRGDRLIALGVDDAGGGRRVSVSLFDVADPAAPGLIKRVSFGDGWSWSSAYGDVKAFTVLEDMLVVPFSGWSESGGYERLQFIGWSPDNLDAFGYVDVQGSVLRSLAHGAHYFGVTTEEVSVIDASAPATPVVVNRIPLAEYVADYQPLAPGLGVEVLQKWQDSSLSVRTNQNGAPLSDAVFVTKNSLSKTFPVPNGLVLVATGYDESNGWRGYYEVFRVDCADPAAPVVAWKLKVDIQPWWGGWWWGGWDVMPMVDAAPGMRMPYYYPWYGGQDDAVQMTENWLGLRGSSEAYPENVGTETPTQGLAVVNVETGELSGVAGLGYPEVTSVLADGGRFWVTTRYTARPDIRGRARSACYLQGLDPATLEMGPAANVPGTLLMRDAATGAWLFEDTQYTDGWNWARQLNTLSWDGADGVVRHLSRLAVPESAGTLLARDGAVYYPVYGEFNGVGSIMIGADGKLAAGQPLSVTNGWLRLLDARGDRLYLSVCGAAVVRCDFGDDAPVLAGVTPVAGDPLGLRFGLDGVYAPLGYAGLAVLPL